MQIIGSKKGQGTQRQPVITLDSAQSKTFINMLYGLGEGEICGLADGYKSVYLDDTPLQNANGEFNFANIKVDFRSGTNDQDYIEGFPDVASETAVNVELKHSIPFVKAFNNLDLDAIRIRLKWGALRSQNAESGDVSGVKIDYAIDLKTDNGGWVEVLTPSINAKTSDAYERSHRIDLPPAISGWQVRVRRLTPNSTSDLVSDKMYVSAITEVIDLKLRYPNTALLGLRYDAESFSNVAKMSARCKGLIIKVPTNYDPISRTYDGLWDGTFKQAYSNNPAWVYYDLCTAERYGLGSRLTQSMIDKWSLYRLAQYCDEMVDDGMGGQEPRFTVNVYIQSADGAFELLSRLAGVFRAISYWDGNSIVLDADIPQDSIYSFSRANVIDGVFEYTGTRSRDRRTVAKVAWDNPANHFKTEYEYVRDEAAIAKFGVRVADISAWGCTSKGQAQRAGIWALKSEQLETRMVTFKVGLDGYIPTPAKVIEISDELFAGRATGGRVLAINKAKTVITLDRTITAKAGDTLVINGDDGTSQRRQIRSVSGDKITVIKAFGDISAENVWVLDSADLATMKFRVLSVTADDNHTFTITAVQYNPAKYDAIDTGAYIDERPISVINPTVQAPTKSVNLSSYHTVNQGVNITTLVIGWEQVAGAVKYAVEWRKDNGNWQTLPPTGTNSIEITGVYSGMYEARVTAISAFGQASTATHSALTQIHSKIGKPPRPTRLSVWGKLFAMDLAWTFANKSDDTNFTEIQVSPNGSTNIVTLGTFAYPTNKHEITGLQGNLTQHYRARIVDKLGNVSDWTAWVSGTTSADADKVLEILSGQISESHLDQALRTPIAKISGLESGLNGIKGQIPSLQSAISAINGQLPTLNTEIANTKRELQTAQSTLQTAVSNITTERNRINTAIRDITALQSANTAKTQELANLTQTVNGHTSSIRDLAVTTGDLSQKYTTLKTVTDTANSEITAIKQTQNGQATSIERLGARFDSLAVGGRNLLKNSQAERAVGNTTTRENFVPAYTLTKPLEPNTAYVLSFEYKTTGNAKTAQVGFVSSVGQHKFKTGLTKTTDWQKGVFKFTTGNNVNQAGYIRFDNEGTTDGQSASLWVRNAKLELGSIPTDYTPAPEDLQTAIDEKASTATLNEFKQTSANADTALGERITAIDTAYKSADTQANAKIATLEQSITDKDSAMSRRVDGLQASYNTLNSTKASVASVTAETQARSTADNALSGRIDSLTSDYNSNKASVASQLKTLSDKDTATASQITSLQANVTTAQNTANTASGKADNAQNTANNALSRANTANSAITAEQRARADADSSLASQITALDTAYKTADNQATAKLGQLEQAITNANQAIATAQSQLTAKFDALKVGGRNLILNSKQTLTVPAGGASNQENQQIRMSVANIDWTTVKQLTLSVDVKHADDLVRAGNRWWRIALELAVPHTDGTTSYPKTMITAPVATAFNGRIAYVWDIPKEIRTVNYAVIFVQNINSSHDIIIANPKLEIGTIATDWTPAPEDLQVDLSPYATNASLDEFRQAQAIKDTATTQKLSQLESDLGGKANATALNNYYTKAQTDSAISGRVDAFSSTLNAVDARTKWTPLTTATDLNTLTTQGNYFITGARTNSPVGGWTYVTVDVPRSDRITQTTWADNAPNTTYRRTRAGTTWTAWEKMATGAELGTKASTASLTTEQQARTNADNALSQRITALDSAYKSADSALTARVATAEQSITTANQAIAQTQQTLTAKIDGLSVGGRNLLFGTSFDNLLNWDNWGGNDVIRRTANKTLHLVADNNQAWRGIAQTVRNIESNQDYMISFYAKSNVGNLRFGYHYRRADYAYFNQYWHDIVLKNEFAFYTIPFKKITNNELDNIYFMFGGNSHKPFDIEIKQLKLEKGTIATDWTPAYEDGDSWQIINQATDLNTLTFAGKYFIQSTNNQNAPVINWLFVQVDNAFDGRIMQKVWQDNNVKNNWIRHRLDGNWGTWEKLVNASELNSVQASINEFKQTQATKDGATAQSIQTMQTTLNGHTASIQQHTQSINGLSAQWMLKVQSGNIVSGIGLASNNGVSDFAVRADKFYIAPPTGGKGDTPFTVLTSPQVINGVQVPAGTYIKSAYIHKASIDTLHIRGNAITVPVSAFTADIITVDNNYTTIQNLYVPAGMGHTMLTFNAIFSFIGYSRSQQLLCRILKDDKVIVNDLEVFFNEASAEEFTTGWGGSHNHSATASFSGTTSQSGDHSHNGNANINGSTSSAWVGNSGHSHSIFANGSVNTNTAGGHSHSINGSVNVTVNADNGHTHTIKGLNLNRNAGTISVSRHDSSEIDGMYYFQVKVVSESRANLSQRYIHAITMRR